MDLLFGGGVGPTTATTSTSSSLATASSSVRDDESISRIPTTAAVASAAATSTTATTTTTSAASHSAAAAAHSGASASASASVSAAAAAAATSAHFNGHDNGPILYDNLNRTSAIDDIRSVVIYIFIITIFLSFFLILPGIRNGKFSTFLCIITSLLVTSIIVISLNGTTWHVGEAPISAPYKAFSRDRIQGDLGVRIGLQSVNISLKAHKYFILHATDGPMIMENTHKYSLLHQPLMVVMAPVPAPAVASSGTSSGSGGGPWGPSYDEHGNPVNSDQPISAAASTFIHQNGRHQNGQQTSDDATSGDGGSNRSLTEDLLLTSRSLDSGIPADTELDADEPFETAYSNNDNNNQYDDGSVDAPDSSVPVVSTRRIVRSDRSSLATNSTTTNNRTKSTTRNKRQQTFANPQSSPASPKTPYTIKRVYVDINYNERFYWIEPMQMRLEYQQALERGLPYPILTVVEYLSQDDAGFSWSRQYRAAGYYTSMLLWVSASVCVLMFCLHCAAPKYGIYAMQALGILLLLTNLNYATLVPRGDQKLVIPFEGQSLTFRFGWNFWLVLVGGCLSLLVGTIIVIIDRLFPNFIFTTVLDVDFDSTSQKTYYEKKYKILGRHRDLDEDETGGGGSSSHDKTLAIHKKPEMPPFMQELKKRSREKKRNANKINMMLENGEKKKTVRHAIGVKLNPAYLSDAASENDSISRYDGGQKEEEKQAISSATKEDEQKIRREPKYETSNEKSLQDERVITSREQTVRL
uniref:DUOXA-like protein C06E1.3 n=1 Tax=Aceria tosichella TaxID=561515 RepID=A0A6G1S339_9ACAR